MAGKNANGEGSIRERWVRDKRTGNRVADGWESRITIEGKRKSFYGKTRQEVAGKLAAAITDHNKGLPITFDEHTTVAAYMAAWLDTMKPPAVRESTWINYEHYSRLHIVPALGRLTLAKLSAQHVKKLQNDKLASRKSSTSVNHMAGILRHALSDAVRLGIIPRNVAELVDPPRIEEHAMQVYDSEQARTFLDAAHGHRLEALFVLWITTGMRQGETLALRWADVDLAAGHLQVKQGRSRVAKGFADASPKTRSGRRKIVLSATAVEALKEHRKRQLAERLHAGAAWQEQGYVFTTSLGTPLDASAARKAYFRLLRDAGLPRIRVHDLRHTAATLLLLQGVPVKVVSEMLGHASTAITMDLYSHVLPDMQRDAAAAMDNLLRRENG